MPNDRDTFDEQRSNQPYTLNGRLLNRQAQQLNRQARSHSPGGHQTTFRGPFLASYSPPPHVQGLAVITDNANTCPVDPNSPTGLPDAPCISRGYYLAKFRYFDHNNGLWTEDAESLRLDCSGFDPVPAFLVGDIVPAYWDEQRGWLIPLVSPYDDLASVDYEDNRALPALILTPDAAAPNPYSVTVTLEWDSGEGWRSYAGRDLVLPVPSRDGERVTGTMFTAFPAADGTKIRLRAGLGALADSDVDVTAYGVRVWAVGRRWLPSGLAHDEHYIAYGGMSTLTPLVIHGESKGRFTDKPFIDQFGDGLKVTILGGIIAWTLYADFRIEIRASAPGSSSSSSTSTSTSSSQSVSTSSSSPSSQSASSVSNSASSQSSGSCAEVVTDVECVEGMLKITKCSICAPGLAMHCEEDSSGSGSGSSFSSSSSQSSSLSSSSLSSLSSQSSSSSTSSDSSQSSSSSSSSTLSSSSRSSSSSSSGGGCGICAYQWDGISWNLTVSECTGGCTCGPAPVEPGEPDEVVFVDCQI